jgi:hypothetical protein
MSRFQVLTYHGKISERTVLPHEEHQRSKLREQQSRSNAQRFKTGKMKVSLPKIGEHMTGDEE